MTKSHALALTIVLAMAGGLGAAGIAAPAPASAAAALTPSATETAAKSPDGLGAAHLALDSATGLTLAPQSSVRYAAPPEKPATKGYGGLASFTAERAGTYRLELGSAAWVDVVGSAGVVPSTAHAHGAEGTGIRKMIDFPLAAGSYTIQVVGNDAPTMAVRVTRLP